MSKIQINQGSVINICLYIYVDPGIFSRLLKYNESVHKYVQIIILRYSNIMPKESVSKALIPQTVVITGIQQQIQLLKVLMSL